MFDKGTYRLYFIKQTSGLPEEQLMGRFMIQSKQFFILEDHHHLLSDNLPEGKMDVWHDKVLWELSHSGYYRIVSEDEVNQGYHEGMLEDLDIGDSEPDNEYMLTGNGYEPMRLEMYGENSILNGKRLSDDELKDLMDKVRSGSYKLLPI